ncbi:431b65df-f055-47f0-b2f0-fa0f1d8c0597 [Thermothielavioides terrestris]|uniref:431b65df-f055-47f0-b2f0-fa0f1d8c0597 n=1 Tax=Thermothielavioides terrestris TaxID=2587410 RepID=A0A446B8N4_9PEZI|nr:431b65df-f055-47f0-b2f0-fa0f1d8c0597 [Thermothielavioides terrestris]
MAAPPVIVFQVLGQQLPGEVCDEIKKQEGFQRACFGRKMEDPDTGILCTEWSTLEAALAYRSSQLASSLAAAAAAPGGGGGGGDKAGTLVLSAPGPWAAVLRAPCTEVFTAFGVEDGFGANAAEFMRSLDGNPPEGYKGAAFGESLADADVDVAGERTARMVLGWTSREAHLEAKAKPGAIQDNIHLVRTLRKAVDLFHVQFKEL